jgi:hypothetical protein
MPIRARRLTVLGSVVAVGNLAAFALAAWLAGPAAVLRQITLLCNLG